MATRYRHASTALELGYFSYEPSPAASFKTAIMVFRQSEGLLVLANRLSDRSTASRVGMVLQVTKTGRARRGSRSLLPTSNAVRSFRAPIHPTHLCPRDDLHYLLTASNDRAIDMPALLFGSRLWSSVEQQVSVAGAPSQVVSIAHPMQTFWAASFVHDHSLGDLGNRQMQDRLLRGTSLIEA